MSWALGVLVALVAVVVTYLPGLAIAAAAGARRVLLLVSAPAVTVASLATAALVFGKLGIVWSIGSIALFIGVIAAIAWLVHFLVVRRRAKKSNVEQLSLAPALWLSIAISALIIAVQLAVVYGRPDSVSQTYDAAFHLNGVQYILDTLNGSSLHLTGLILPEGQSSFYPAGWHDLISVVAMMTGENVVAAANMTNLVVAAFVWPLGVFALVQILAPRRKAVLVIAAFVATAAPSFPMGMLDYGVLYPYFLALAFLPGAIALGLSIIGLVDRRLLGPIVLQVLALVASVGSMAVAQTSVVFGFGAIALVGLCAWTVKTARSAERITTRLAVPAALAVVAIAFVSAWWKVGSIGYTAPWQPYTTPWQATFEALVNSRNGTPPAVLLAILLLVAIVAELRCGRWWLPVMWAIPAFLFVLSATLPSGDLRNAALGIFYKDPPRFWALTAPLSLVLAVLGAAAIWTYVMTRISARSGDSRRLRIVAAAAGLAMLMIGTQGVAVRSEIERATAKYELSDNAQILSSDERALISRLRQEVPEGAVIVGNPWTGTSWAYALSDREVLNPHFNSSTAPDNVMVNRHLNDVLDDPDVCDAVKRTGVTHVLDFGEDTFGGRITVDTSIGYEGLLDLDESDAVEEVDRENDRVLYRITACGL